MGTIYWHMNATQGVENLHPGVNLHREHGYTGMVDQEQCSVVQRLAKSRTVVVM